MTPVPCIAEPGEFGDCWRACIATILDLAASDVPHFFGIAKAETVDGADCCARAYVLAREWLGEHGLGIFRFYVSGRWSLAKLLDDFSGFSPEVPFILHGEPARPGPGEEAHAVVALNGAIAHDPSGVGIAGPCRCDCDDESCEGFWWMDVISPARDWFMGDRLP